VLSPDRAFLWRAAGRGGSADHNELLWGRENPRCAAGQRSPGKVHKGSREFLGLRRHRAVYNAVPSTGCVRLPRACAARNPATASRSRRAQKVIEGGGAARNNRWATHGRCSLQCSRWQGMS